MWKNQFLCHYKKSIYGRDSKDLISENNTFSYDTSSIIDPEQGFFLMSIIKASIEITIADPIPTIQMESGNMAPVLDLTP